MVLSPICTVIVLLALFTKTNADPKHLLCYFHIQHTKITRNLLLNPIPKNHCFPVISFLGNTH